MRDQRETQQQQQQEEEEGRKQREKEWDDQQQQELQHEGKKGRQQTQTQQEQKNVFDQQQRRVALHKPKDEEKREQHVQQEKEHPHKAGGHFQQEREQQWDREKRSVPVAAPVAAAVAELLQPPCSINEVAILPCSSFSICCGALLPSCSLDRADAAAAAAAAAREAAAPGEGGGEAAAEEGSKGAAEAGAAGAAKEFRRASSSAAAAAASVAVATPPRPCWSSQASPAEPHAAAASPHKAPSQSPGSRPDSGFVLSAETQHTEQQQQPAQGQQQQPEQEGKQRQQGEAQGKQQQHQDGTQQKTQQQQQVREDQEGASNAAQHLQQRQAEIQDLPRQQQKLRLTNEREGQRQQQQCTRPFGGQRVATAQRQSAASASPTRAAGHSNTRAACPRICVVPASDDTEEAAGAAAALAARTARPSPRHKNEAAPAAVAAAGVSAADAVGRPRWNLLLCCCCVPSVYAAATSLVTAAAATCMQQPCSSCRSRLAETLSVSEASTAEAATSSAERPRIAARATDKEACPAAAARHGETKVQGEQAEETAGDAGEEERRGETDEEKQRLLQNAARRPTAAPPRAAGAAHLAAGLAGAAACTLATAAAGNAAVAVGEETPRTTTEGGGRTAGGHVTMREEAAAAAGREEAAARVGTAAALTGWIRLVLLFNCEFPPALQLARLRLDAFVAAVAVAALAGSRWLASRQQQPRTRQQEQPLCVKEKRRHEQRQLQHKRQQEQVQGEEKALHTLDQQHTQPGVQHEQDEGLVDNSITTRSSGSTLGGALRSERCVIDSSRCAKYKKESSSKTQSSRSRSTTTTRKSSCSSCRERNRDAEDSDSSTAKSRKSSSCSRSTAENHSRTRWSSATRRRRRGRSSSARGSSVMCWMCSTLAACALPAMLNHQGKVQQQGAEGTSTACIYAVDESFLLKTVHSFFLEELRVSALLISQEMKSGVLWEYRRTVWSAALHALLQLLLCRRRSIHAQTVASVPLPCRRLSSTANSSSRSDRNYKKSRNNRNRCGSSRRGTRCNSGSNSYSRHVSRDKRRSKGGSSSGRSRVASSCSSCLSSRICSSCRSWGCSSKSSKETDCMPSPGRGLLPRVFSPAAGTADVDFGVGGSGLAAVAIAAEDAAAVASVAAAPAAERSRAAATEEADAGPATGTRAAASSTTPTAERLFPVATKKASAAEDNGEEGKREEKQAEEEDGKVIKSGQDAAVEESGTLAASAAAEEKEERSFAGNCAAAAGAASAAAAADGAAVTVALSVDTAARAAEEPVTAAEGRAGPAAAGGGGGGGVVTATVKTGQEATAAANNARSVREGDGVLKVFYEMLDEELLLIEQQAAQRLHAYHPWEHLARLLPLWREFELSATASLHASNFGRAGLARVNRRAADAAARTRTHSDTDTAAASSTVVTTAAAAATRRSSAASTQSSEGYAAPEKGLQYVTLGTASHAAVSPQRAPTDESQWPINAAVGESGVPSYKNPPTAVVARTENLDVSQRCAADSDELPVECCQAAAEASTSYVFHVDTVNNVLENTQVNVFDSNLCESCRQCSTGCTPENSNREAELRMKRSHRRGAATEKSTCRKGAAAAVEARAVHAAQPRAEAAVVAACGRKAASAADAGVGPAASAAAAVAVQDIAAVEGPDAALAAASSQEEEQQDGLCTLGGPKALVAHCHTLADADTKFCRVHAFQKAAPQPTRKRGEEEREEENGEGRQDREEEKGNAKEGGQETNEQKESVGARETENNKEKGVFEDGISASVHGKKFSQGRRGVNGEEKKAEEERRTVDERVDAFLQHQIGMLPQCRAPYHVLARRFYEQMQSRMEVVEWCLSRVVSAGVAAADVYSPPAARANNTGAAGGSPVRALVTSTKHCISPRNRPTAAVRSAARSRSSRMNSPARSALPVIPGSTFSAAAAAAASVAARPAARPATEECGDSRPSVRATELHEARYNSDTLPLYLPHPTHLPGHPLSAGSAALTAFPKETWNSSPTTHSHVSIENGCMFTPYGDCAARHCDTTVPPGQSSTALLTGVLPIGETTLEWTCENKKTGESSHVALRKKGHTLAQFTDLSAYRLEFVDVLQVQEQLLTDYLGTNYEVIKLFPHLEAPWSGRSDLYTAYLRVWSGYVINVQRRAFLQAPDGGYLLETWNLPKKSQGHVQQPEQHQLRRQQQKGEELQGTGGEKLVELCASREISGDVAGVSVNCEADEHFLLGSGRAYDAATRQKILQQRVLSFGDAVQQHLRDVVRREVNSNSLFLSMKKQDQRTPLLPLKGSSVTDELGAVIGKCTIPESIVPESAADRGTVIRWVARHQCRLGRELDRTIESLRQAAWEVKNRRAHSSSLHYVAEEAGGYRSAASWRIETGTRLREKDATVR